MELDIKDTLVKLIGKYGAFKTGVFSLEHRDKTAHYVVYLSELFSKGAARVTSELMANLIRQSNVEFDRVVGILMREPGESRRLSREGYHLAPIVASMLKKPYVLLYEARDKQTGELYFFHDGELLPEERVIIIDDVLTTGGSIINAVNYLRRIEENIAVHDAFVFVSRPHGEILKAIQERLDQMNVTLHFMIDSRELLQGLYQQGYIGEAELREAYKDPDFEGSTPPD
jgi:orotate phosphoribosyltransferase